MKKLMFFFKKQKVFLKLLIQNTAKEINTLLILLIIIWQCAFKSKSFFNYFIAFLYRLGMLEECIIYLKETI